MDPIITIVDDNLDFLDYATILLTEKIPGCKVYTFSDPHEIFKKEEVCNTDLFILDVELQSDLNGKDLCLSLTEVCPHSTYLFVSGFDYDFEAFSDLRCTYDFISKPIRGQLLKVRTQILLNVANHYKTLGEDIKRIKSSLYELINHSNLYLLLIDEQFKVSLCNYSLAHDLGFEHESELIGYDWREFIPEENIDLISEVHINIISTYDTCSRYSEVTNDIKTMDGSLITTKWFNACIKNGVKYTFSIGMPTSKPSDVEDNIDAIRAYWKNIIQKDQTTINAFRDVIKKETA